jgi:4-amino-4-deoxy-L-arabinose transferase-like glycosyltransferase
LLTAIDRFAARYGRLAMTPRGVLAIWATVLLLLFAMRAFLFTGTDADDAEQLIYMQSWSLGYGARNPPVFTWLVIMVQPIFGVAVASVVFVKFMLLAGSFYLLYRSGEIVLGDRSLAALAALSPIALYYVSWDAAFHYTHSVILAFAVCLTFYQLLVLERRRDLVSYVLFGIGVAFGLLSKYNYLIFLAVLLAAVFFERDMRRIFLDWRMLVATGISIVLAAPHYFWLWQQRAWLSAMAKDRFNPGGPSNGPFNLAGVGETLTAVINFVLPLAIFYLALFPRAWGKDGLQAAPNVRHRRLLDSIILGIILLTLAGVICFGAVRVRTHYMFLLILIPIAFLARAQAAGIVQRMVNLFALSLLGFAVIVPTAVLIKYAIDPMRHSKAYFHVPYAEFAARLKDAGFSDGTIIGDWFGYPLAGNFRPYFPNARIINLLDWQLVLPKEKNLSRFIAPPQPDERGQCLLLWTPTADGARKAAVIEKANELLGAGLPDNAEAHLVTAEMTNGHGRTLSIAYILIHDGPGNCR